MKRAGAKFKRLMTGKKKYAVIGAALVGVYLLTKHTSAGGGVTLVLQPAKINPGEAVAAQSYRIIAERRPGMQYTSAQEGQSGIEFSFASGGVFTRNFVQENGVLMAEIANR